MTKLSMSLQFPIKVLQAEIDLDGIREPLIEAVNTGAIERCENQRSNIGANAWRSSMTLHNDASSKFKTERSYEAVSKLVERIVSFSDDCVRALYKNGRQVIEECWINRLDVGAYNAPHDHFPSDWSGILWIDSEDNGPFPSGSVEFMSPYPSRVFGENASSFFVQPVNGAALFFPSGLKHMVHPVTRTRISVAWNCRIEEQ